jgi:NAD+ diphosphatase
VAASGFVRTRRVERPPDGNALYFVFAGQRLVLRLDEGQQRLPASIVADGLWSPLDEPLYIGALLGTPCVAVRVAPDDVPDGYAAHDLRSAHGLLPEPSWVAAGVAYQLLNWMDDTRYCPRTGDLTHVKADEWAKQCPSCDLVQYPLLHPCVIGLVYDGDRVLLTRQASWPAGRYGLVAGFVEPGETLEQCMAREVGEETGLEIDDVRYVASQAWPFPHQVMVGFTARFAGGRLAVDPAELEDARWFSLDDLPILPPPFSIARRIIDAHVASHREQIHERR